MSSSAATTSLQIATASPKLHRFSVAQYLQMAQSGVLTEQDRVILVDGVIYEMSPIGHAHAWSVSRLDKFLQSKAPPQLTVYCQQPLKLATSMPEPDLMLLTGDDSAYRTRYPVAVDVQVLIEVADTTLAFDSGQKLAIYAAAEIPEYWIVDLTHRQLRRYTEPDPSTQTYRRCEVFENNATLTWNLSHQQTIDIDLQSILP